MSSNNPTHRQLRGVLCVFQTPYHDDETVDFDTLRKEIEFVYDSGADGIVMAMASDLLRLSDSEREQMAERVCNWSRDHGVAVISVGAECSLLAERFAKQAESVGADALMAIPPVSIAVDDDELLRYYERLIKAVKIPLIVQDASGYVGRPMSIYMQAALLEEFGDRVMYKPEATPIGPRLAALKEATGGRAKVFEGTGGIALTDTYPRGIEGTMPGADLIDILVVLWRALVEDDIEAINRIHPLLCSMISLQLSLDSFLAFERHLLVKRGIFKNEISRGPVAYKLDQQTRQEIDRLFELLQAAIRV